MITRGIKLNPGRIQEYDNWRYIIKPGQKTRIHMLAEAEFKEFEPRLKFRWFHFKLYSMSQLKPIFWGFETQVNSLNLD